ncbi:MAG: TIGR02281 family clan AA aspartic protease [Pseudomonadales bacterium]|nr:TIGR02281 family clan AA aspartic protease [Pseudomonadales bacterium]
MRRLLPSLLLTALAAGAAASEVEVVGLFKDRAVLRTVTGERMLRVGETTPDGVTLLAADARSARVRVNGVVQTLTLDTRGAGRFTTPAPAQIAIPPDSQGQYRVRGTVNGRMADFLVDTGASIVVMSSVHARSLGVSFEQGQKGSIQTAQGVVAAFFLPLDEVAVAGISSRAVQAAVVDGDFPADILLGMSFLRDVAMEARDGVLTLKRR